MPYVKSHKRSSYNGKVTTVKAHSKSSTLVKGSSCVNRVSHSKKGLTVTLKGKRYTYPDTPYSKYRSMIAAKSKGKFYNAYIK